MAVLFFAFAETVCAQSAAATQRLNVLFIVADDLNNHLGCYGHTEVKTPNVNRLAQRGVRFDRAYVQFALCNPSRASFLSGLRPDTTGIHDLLKGPRAHLPDWIFLPQFFRQSGYFSASVGKFFHHSDPASWDLEIPEQGKNPPNNQIAAQGTVRGYRDEDGWRWVKLNTTDEETPDGIVARQVAELLEGGRPAGKPFFLGVGFRRPHGPYAAPAKWFDLYSPEKIPPLVEPPGHAAEIPRAALTYDSKMPAMPEEKRREGVAAYYACISFMDAQVGVILDALDRNHLWETTIVVLVGDHGYHLGEHEGLWAKDTNFEESARAPLIIAAPGLRANASSSRVVEFVDLYPTLTAAAGLPTPGGLAGTSLLPLLADPERAWNRPAFTQVTRKDNTIGRSIRTERWRYLEWDEGRQGSQLYDESQDPREFVNLVHDAAHAGTVQELKETLRRSIAATPPARPTTRAKVSAPSRP